MSFFVLAAQKQGGGQYLRRANMFGPTVPIDPSVYYTPGQGRPAISTADYYLLDGCYWYRCYDLLTMGSPGAAIAASRGRYVWFVAPDHPATNNLYSGSCDFRVGFSSDPGIPPDVANLGLKYNATLNFGGQTSYSLYQAPYLVYNPDDASTPFWMYAEGSASSIQHEEGLAKSADLITWTVYGYTHHNTQFLDWSSFQRVVRVGTGSWYSVGLSTSPTHVLGGFGKWTSTDGLTFTQVSTGLRDVIGNSTVLFSGTDLVNISGQDYALVREDNYNIPPYLTASTGATAPVAGAVRQGMYVSLCPVDSDFNGLTSPDIIRISDVYTGVYAGPSYLQSVTGYVEDGVLHIWATHGFYPSATNFSTANAAIYALGGGLQEEFIDYYTYIVDATAAAAAAPVGVSASCDAGVVTVSWYDALPNRTYRVYKGSSAGTQATLVGDTTTCTITDSPTSGQWWYKVVTLQSGTERGNRVAHCYVSGNSELANKHVNRVIDDGGDVSTINQTWLQTCIDWATTNGLENCIEYWADAAFGVKLSAGQVVKVYCLGTTILPRGGDLTMATSHTTYSVTGLNSTAPAWTNPATTDRAYWGGERVNNIRRKTQCTMFAAYKKPDTSKASFIGSDHTANAFGVGLEHVSGTPGNVNFYLTDATHKVSATATLASATGVNVIIGFFDGTNVTAYGNGVTGTPQTGLDPNLKLEGLSPLKGLIGPNVPHPCVASGCSQTQCSAPPVVRTYQRAEAKWTASTIGMFSKGFTDAQAISFDAMQATHIGR